jgi:hypothetical protein
MTKVINLQELARKEPDVVIVTTDGERHEMIPATVESFIENVKLVEGLGTAASVVDEMEVMIKIITRSFPTISEAEVRSWPLENLQSISDLARGQNGELVTTDEEKLDEAIESGNG